MHDSRDDVRLVRAELVAMHQPHGRWLTDVQVASVFAKVGSVGLTADAIVLSPRPEWVKVLLGPMPDLEMLHPDDRAMLSEWGGGGIGT